MKTLLIIFASILTINLFAQASPNITIWKMDDTVRAGDSTSLEITFALNNAYYLKDSVHIVMQSKITGQAFTLISSTMAHWNMIYIPNKHYIIKVKIPSVCASGDWLYVPTFGAFMKVYVNNTSNIQEYVKTHKPISFEYFNLSGEKIKSPNGICIRKDWYSSELFICKKIYFVN